MRVEFGVLGPVLAWDGAGAELNLKGPRHRAVLARLVAARGRVVPVDRLVDDLWGDSTGSLSAVRTFVAALRRALEPDREPRQPAKLLVTEGQGYALRAAPDDVDAWRFANAVDEAAKAPPPRALELLDAVLPLWRGEAYADFDEAWARTERNRLDQLRLNAIEQRARALLDLGRPEAAIADLEGLASEHPWREEAWRLLALALYRNGRQGEALAALRRARAHLLDELGLDPSPQLQRLETDLLRQADTGQSAADRVWNATAAAFDQAVPAGAPARLESTIGLLRGLALTGPTGLGAAREQRYQAVAAVADSSDPELTARVIGAYDVPAIWTRSDDPAQAAKIAAAAERALKALEPDGNDTDRTRLLSVVALESRGNGGPHAAEAAAEAERIARRLGDPALLAFALNGVYMQTFHRTGLAPERDAIGAELIDLATRHSLPAFAILGHLIRLQSRSALADFEGADEHAKAADRLAERHGRPLVGVFTGWYRAMRAAATGGPFDAVEAAYRTAAANLEGSGMPGVERGLPSLAVLCLQVNRDRPIRVRESEDWGPYRPWTSPLLLIAEGRREQAAKRLRSIPDPPRDLMQEAMWALVALAAIELDDRPAMRRAWAELLPAHAELAGAGSGMLYVGPVAGTLDALEAALRCSEPET
ncbi:AfsR/SARP family transcriptional regulator [Glycomyces harbinensis]|uniref:DNA-binding transcriptional activator of the SARP family n=1 Tax=Glycomyces harbinensis TaxID=58114 RepID=A0A1G7B0Z2_9ACTN|nr:BTAD domain-containing putative transcriptional regulator [Glycomyces harbinensis]SDE20778.1 DNA-binding transcriptional activator of the SARP family [Glycomyces harbinensis]